MKVLELFAGAGGAALGLESAGFEHAALCEWDENACATLRAAGLGPVVEGDVRDLDAIAAVAEDVDLIWSSFPCQAWSMGGKRKGAQDDRNGWPWTVDAIDRFKPKWFLGENVKGLIQHRSLCPSRRLGTQKSMFEKDQDLSCAACYFEHVILAELRKRFDYVGWFLLDAADYGVPQHRRRVILWAGPSPLLEPEQTHGPGASRLWTSMASALNLSPGEQVIGGGRNPAKGASDRRYRVLTNEPSTTVAAVRIGNAGPWVVPQGLNPSTKSVNASEAKTLERRRLSLEEYATLQGFPEGHPFQGTSTARRRQIGNAVPPRLAQVVGQLVMNA